MRAVVIERPGVSAWREVTDPEPGPDDVLVRSRAVGLCRTDLEILHGALPPGLVRYPCIPGHEWSGIVEAVGAGVEGIETGDRVVCEGNVPCGHCDRCRAGETNLCRTYDQLGFTREGGCAELVHAPARLAHRLPEHVDLESAVLIEPAATVMRALERAGLEAGESVGVVGIGAVGALAILLARLFAPGRVVAFGVRAEELALARRLGADEAVDASEGPPAAGAGPDGLDVSVEAAGGIPAMVTALRSLRPGGRGCLLGVTGGGRQLPVPADEVVLRDLRVYGLLSYTSASWARVVDVVREGLVDLSPVLGPRVPIADHEQAFALLEAGGAAGKIVLRHDGDG